MVSRRCCCTGCACASCSGGMGPCCFIVSIGDTDYSIVWTASCTWENEEGTLELIISEGTLTITLGEETYSLSIGLDAECKSFDHVEVPNTDEISASAYVTANGRACYSCWCYCDQCAEKYDGKNAACCFSVYQGTEKIALLSRNSEEDGYSGCAWSGTTCGESGAVDVTLSITSDSATLTVGEDSYNLEFEDSPNCCVGMEIGPYTLYAGSDDDCSEIEYECVQLTISGVVSTCSCTSCNEINGTFSLQWTGNRYEGTLCNDSRPYIKCEDAVLAGWSYAIVLTRNTGEGNTAEVRIYGYDNTFGVLNTVVWKGISDSLTYYSGDNSVCDFSGSTCSLSFGPQCAPCGDSDTCVERQDDCTCCKGDSYPEYYEITIPDDWSAGAGGWHDGEDRVFLVPAQCGSFHFVTGERGYVLPSCIRGNICGIGTYIEFYWSNTAGSECVVECYRLVFTIGFGPADFCEGDHLGNMDCWLYGLEQPWNFSLQYRNTFNFCGRVWQSTPWNGASITVKAV